MKKIFAILICCLIVTSILSCSSLAKQDKEQQFVNPLFYMKLSPISRDTRITFLQPNKIKTIDIFGNDEIIPCKLLENTKTQIALECLEYNQTFIYKYVLKPCATSDDYCYNSACFVKEYNYSPGEETFNSLSTFVIE